jgi:hypothetical protein
MPSQEKSWYASKTIWLNVFSAVIAVGSALQGQAIIQEYPALASGLVVVLNIANVALRLITSTKIG